MDGQKLFLVFSFNHLSKNAFASTKMVLETSKKVHKMSTFTYLKTEFLKKVVLTHFMTMVPEVSATRVSAS